MGRYLDLWDISEGHPKAREELERLSKIEGAADQAILELEHGFHEKPVAEAIRILREALGSA